MSAQPYREPQPYREAERELHLVAPLAPPSQLAAPATRPQAVVGRATIAVSTLSGVLLALALHGGHL
jgi:hypothetical protein